MIEGRLTEDSDMDILSQIPEVKWIQYTPDIGCKNGSRTAMGGRPQLNACERLARPRTALTRRSHLEIIGML
jgi:hypothetical protein